jgi:hypothetical protein
MTIVGPKLRTHSLLARQGEAAGAVERLNRIVRVAKPMSIRTG